MKSVAFGSRCMAAYFKWSGCPISSGVSKVSSADLKLKPMKVDPVKYNLLFLKLLKGLAVLDVSFDLKDKQSVK